MQLQGMALSKNIFNTFREFFLREKHVIYDSNMWISAFFFFFCITRTSLYLVK